MNVCRVAGCGARASSAYSRLCNSHRSRVRRQGDPLQRTVRKKDLAPYLELVERRIAANAGSPVWTKMEARWATLVRDAKHRIAEYESGSARPRQTIEAAREVVRLDASAGPRRVLVTASAVMLMHNVDPLAFRSDDGFDFQLVRRVRGLTTVESTSCRDGTGRVRRTYQQMPPRAVAVLAGWLRETFGVLGLHLARLEREERDAKNREDRELGEALAALKP